MTEKRALMRELLESSLDRDLRLGRTSRGPHRDDIDLTIDGKSVRAFGSHHTAKRKSMTSPSRTW